MGLIPAFVFVLGIVLSLRAGLPLAGAVGAGAVAWAALTLLTLLIPRVAVAAR